MWKVWNVPSFCTKTFQDKLSLKISVLSSNTIFETTTFLEWRPIFNASNLDRSIYKIKYKLKYGFQNKSFILNASLVSHPLWVGAAANPPRADDWIEQLTRGAFRWNPHFRIASVIQGRVQCECYFIHRRPMPNYNHD